MRPAPSRRAPDQLPRRSRGERASAEDGYEAERDRSEGDAPEAGGKQEVERSPFDEEANARQHADERRDDCHRGVEREPCVVELVRGLQRVARREERRPGREQADEQDLAEEPRPIRLGPSVVHGSLVGSAPPADKRERGRTRPHRGRSPADARRARGASHAAGLRRRRRGRGWRRRDLRGRELQPDIVLLDLTMPGMDGLTALPQIREHAPVIRDRRPDRVRRRGEPARGDPRRRVRLPPQDRASRADRGVPPRCRARRRGAVGRRRAHGCSTACATAVG